MILGFRINKINNGNENIIDVDFINKTYKTGYNCNQLIYRIIIKAKDMEYLLKQLKENNFTKLN